MFEEVLHRLPFKSPLGHRLICRSEEPQCMQGSAVTAADSPPRGDRDKARSRTNQLSDAHCFFFAERAELLHNSSAVRRRVEQPHAQDQ